MEFLKQKNLSAVSIVTLLLIALSNTIDLALSGRGLADYFMHSFFFIFLTLIIVICEKFFRTEKVHIIIFLISGIAATILGNAGNATGVIFFPLVIKLLYDVRAKSVWNYVVFIIIAISIMLKGVVNAYGWGDFFQFILLYSYIIIVYYATMHPKKTHLKKIEGLTAGEVELIQLVIQGHSLKDIGELMQVKISAVTVRGKIKRVRDKIGAKTNEQLIYILSKIGAFD